MAVTNFESGSSFPPLPPGKSGRNVTRSGTFIDVEILGSLVGNDIYSSNWDGFIPLDIDDSGDSTGTTGYALDASTGQIQATRLFVSPGETETPAVSYVEDASTGFFFYLAGVGPSGGDGAISAICSGGAGWSLNNDSSSTGTFALGHDASGTVNFLVVRGSVEVDGRSGSLFTYGASPVPQSGSAVVLYSNGTDYDLVPTSSTRRDKKYVTKRDDLADIELVPSRYQRRGRKPLVGHQRPEGDNPWEYGLIVEDLIGQDPTLGIWDQNVGEYNDYDTRAVIAVLAAKVNRSDGDVVRLNGDVAALTATVTTLMDRVAELESRLTELPV